MAKRDVEARRDARLETVCWLLLAAAIVLAAVQQATYEADLRSLRRADVTLRVPSLEAPTAVPFARERAHAVVAMAQTQNAFEPLVRDVKWRVVEGWVLARVACEAAGVQPIACP